MDLGYSEEQLLLRDSVGRFLAEEYGFAQRQRIAADAAGYSAEIWRQFAELGWLALPLPETVGGLGGGAVELGLLMQEFGKALLLEPYLANLVLGAGAVLLAGDAAQRAALLPGVAEGRCKLALAHTERSSRYDLAAVSATAQGHSGGWRLEGRKSCVLGAAAADFIIVSARICGHGGAPGGIGLFLVPRATAGLELEPYALIDGSRAADLHCRGLVLAPDALLGGCEDALPVLEEIFDRALIALAADSVGALSVLLDATVEYSKVRAQFGQPIGRFQALQHRMAELAVEREEAGAIALFATLAADAPPPQRARAASAAKVKVGRAARHIAEQAVQIHGGMGVTEELNIGAYFKRVLVHELLFGSADHHLRRYAALAQRGGFIRQGLIVDDAAEAAPAMAAA